MSLVFLLLVLVALISAKVYKPRRGISKWQAYEEYNRFWNKTHSSVAEKNARFFELPRKRQTYRLLQQK